MLYDVDEAAEALQLRRCSDLGLIRSGQLRTVEQGRRRLVPVTALAGMSYRWAARRDWSCKG